MKHRHASFAPAAIFAAATLGAALPATSALAQPAAASAAGGRGERMVEALQKRFAAADGPSSSAPPARAPAVSPPAAA